jgi:hypothetical protein
MISSVSLVDNNNQTGSQLWKKSGGLRGADAPPKQNTFQWIEVSVPAKIDLVGPRLF